MLSFSDYKDRISKSVHYHIENNIPFAENIYRVHSEEFYKLFREARELYNEGLLTELTAFDKELLNTDIGEFGLYEKRKVPLDVPIQVSEDEKDPPLNKPKRGGPKKFYVFVKDGDKIKKVTFGDPNMSIKRDSPERRKSFRARHNCDNPGPKTKARYWSCFQWRAGAKVDN